MQLRSLNDNKMSSFTGYTREHWIEITKNIVSGFMPYADPVTGIFKFDGDPEETALHRQLRAPGGIIEAFERVHMAAAAYIALTGKTNVPGYGGDFSEVFRTGIDTFTNPKSRYFSRENPVRTFGSGTVIAMLIAPEKFLDTLPKTVKKNLAEILSHFIHRKASDSNILLFSMMPAVILDRLGKKYDRSLLDDYFERILGMYRGDGWFIDGWNQGFDHYNFWGFQFYLHLFLTFDRKWRRKYGERLKEITRKHEDTVLYYFGKDGAPIPKGRSLNYRFAAVSGIGAAQVSGLSEMDPGIARRICSGALKYFWENGCLSKKGLIEPGFLGGNTCAGEDYTDYGAPYWSATGLIPAVLPKTHPFWTSEEKPVMADTPGIKRCLIRGANMVLKADGRRGEARMHSVGEIFKHKKVWQAGSKYFQHSYSSTVGYALAGDLGRELAAGRTGISSDGKRWSFRTWPRVLELDKTQSLSEWDAWAGLDGETGTVVTESKFLDNGEMHVFWHTSEKPKYLCIGGYAVQVAHGELPKTINGKKEISIKSKQMWSIMKVFSGVPGKLETEKLTPKKGFKHSHIFEGWSVFTRWTSSRPVLPGVKIAVWVDAARRTEVPEIKKCPIK